MTTYFTISMAFYMLEGKNKVFVGFVKHFIIPPGVGCIKK